MINMMINMMMMIKLINVIVMMIIIKFINVTVGLVSITPGHVKLD